MSGDHIWTSRATGAFAPALAAAVALSAFTSCGGGGKDRATDAELSASSTCSEFLDAAEKDRSRALRQLAVGLGIPDAVTPVGATQVDYTCAQDPDGTLGGAVSALGGQAAEPSAEPPTDAGPVSDPEAQQAAEDGVEVALSYSWDTLDADMAAAEAVMTREYWQEAQQTWDVVKSNAPTTETTVDVTTLTSGVLTQDTSEGIFLVFIDRPTTNKSNTTPIVYKDAVLVTVTTDDSGTWLISGLDTAGSSNVPAAAGSPAAVAEDLIAKLNTYTPADLGPDGAMDDFNAEVESMVTPAFYGSYTENADTFIALLEQGVEASYTAVGAAAADADAESATVLVAGHAVKAVGGEEDEPLLLRVSVDVVNVDGEWLVDEFTQVAS